MNFQASVNEKANSSLSSPEPELTGRAILSGGQTSDTHVTAKVEP